MYIRNPSKNFKQHLEPCIYRKQLCLLKWYINRSKYKTNIQQDYTWRFALEELEPVNTALVVTPHPDDAEFLCGGTLALLALRNWEIHIATSTAGDLGSRTLPPNEIAEIRRGEGVAAARIIGAHYHCLELKDLQVFYGEKGLSRVIALLRRIQPDLVITHSPSCYMIDHE